MKDDADLSRRLESMDKPQVSAEQLKSQIRLTLMNTRASSRIGLGLVLIPALFIAAIVLHYGFGLPVPGLSSLEEMMVRLDRTSGMGLLVPLILVGAPLLASAVALLGVLHVERDRRANELRISVKLRWTNLLIAAAGLGVVAVAFAHAIADR